MKFAIKMLLPLLFCCVAFAEDAQHRVQTETLSQASSAWDGAQYKAYPSGQPQITVLKITIPANTALKWHSHPFPSVAYILSGDLTVEKKDGTKLHFVAGQTVTETVDTIHRGLSGSKPAVLIVFYSGIVGKPLSY